MQIIQGSAAHIRPSRWDLDFVSDCLFYHKVVPTGLNNLKDLIFTITTSRTYQLPSVGIKSENDAIAADYTFRGMHRRRLSAEQFADAVSAIVQSRDGIVCLGAGAVSA